MSVIIWREYLDKVDEALATIKFLDPPLYIQHTPKLFNAWHKWSMDYKEDEKMIRPMGNIPGPDWMKTEFKGLEDFYQYYLEFAEQEVF